VTVRREFKEEAGNLQDESQRETFNRLTDELFASGEVVYRGYVDDPRNTDYAWMETTAFHFHCDTELGAMLPLASGDDAAAVMWLDVDADEPRYANLYASHRVWVDHIQRVMRRRAEGHQEAIAMPADGASGDTEWQAALTTLAADPTAREKYAHLPPSSSSLSSCTQVDHQVDNLSQLIEKSRAEEEKEATAQHGKFAGSTFTMAFTDLPTFHSGLEALIGSPSPNLLPQMEVEHCKAPDSDMLFVTSNYGIETTSRIEWWFVMDPLAGLTHLGLQNYPSETHDCSGPRMRGAAGTKTHLRPRLAENNARLQEMDEEILLEAEMIGGRLYTGPSFQKYNAVLRALVKNAAEPFTRQFQELCQGNRYTTTIHVINSLIVKSSKLTTVTKVYRGSANGVLPKQFWEPNKQGVRGGVEASFMSTSTAMEVAVGYAGGRDAKGTPMVFELVQGMVDRGADISWLSQYPHEQEVVFAPLTCIEVQRSRVDGNMIIVTMSISINLLAPTIEKVVAKMQNSHVSLIDLLVEDVRKSSEEACDELLELKKQVRQEEPAAFNGAEKYRECTNRALDVKGRLEFEAVDKKLNGFKMAYGDARDFQLGLSVLGVPARENVLEALRAEHCAGDDYSLPFTCSKTQMETTPQIEWHFVVEPETGLTTLGIHAWPAEMSLTTVKAPREPKPPSAFNSARAARDAQLKDLGLSPLRDTEFLACRLAMGGMFFKYNHALRGVILGKQVPGFIKNLHEINRGNLYVTTISELQSGILRLAKITQATPIFRGILGVLPHDFFTSDASGLQGACDVGFAGTSTERSIAIDNSTRNDGPLAMYFEIVQAMDRGADLSWLSLYPLEKEVTLPACTFLEVQGRRVEMQGTQEQLVVRVAIRTPNP